jgi:esterase
VPEARANGIRLYYEEHGDGAPIACVHGGGSSALLWGDAVVKLAGIGRAIAYDRRGCARSERPEPYESTTVAEQTDDAAFVAEHLGAG